jgi:hypothetical protein
MQLHFTGQAKQRKHEKEQMTKISKAKTVDLARSTMLALILKAAGRSSSSANTERSSSSANTERSSNAA